MFYTFIQTNDYPHDNSITAHKVTFTSDKIIDPDFVQFMNDWDLCDVPSTPYYLYFDTSHLIHTPEIKYAIRIANFIKKKRKASPKYLKYSIIYVKSKTVLLLLRMVFNLTAPIAPVYIICDNEPEYVKWITTTLIQEESIPKTPGILQFKP